MISFINDEVPQKALYIFIKDLRWTMPMKLRHADVLYTT